MMEKEREGEGERNGPPLALGADISALPEGCISDIVSLTSPKDACRVCAVSPILCDAAESNAVWERFLPSDYQAIIARSSSSESLNLCSKKQIYLSLSDNPILIDDSKKSFFLDKSSGKKCYLLSARELSVVWGNTPEHWRWISLPEESRFPEVAELNYVWFFDISGKMSTSILSPKTHYATYLVYKLGSRASGFDGPPFNASVGTIGGEVYEQTVRLGLFVMEPNQQHTSSPKQREDGWLEIELGQFLNEGGEDDELQIKLMEVNNDTMKTGLIVEGIEIRPTKDISALPEECISLIFSLTSPKDACRVCAVSPIFRAAAESNAVWERFLPSDYQAIIARSSSSSSESFNLSSKKQIYLSLSDNPILIDDSKKSFFLDKSSGKKCYLLSARELSIVWGNTPEYWRWISLPEESRFPEVAELNYVWFFDISGKMSTSILSPKTHYATYLVYKLGSRASGFDGPPFNASVGTIGGEVYEQTVRLGLFVMEPNQQHTLSPKQREDGWLEIELGQFLNEGGEDDELQIKLMEVNNDTMKTGLIVEGIEIRPTKV